jgi:ribosome-binding protein aMBF1 (putative translation factor)
MSTGETRCKCDCGDIAQLLYIAKMRSGDDDSGTRPVERIRQRLAGADEGWFFARIAHQVADRRAALGLSQRELAERVGTTQSAIARLERGGRPPRIDTLLRIADALGCDLNVDLKPR